MQTICTRPQALQVLIDFYGDRLELSRRADQMATEPEIKVDGNTLWTFLVKIDGGMLEKWVNNKGQILGDYRYPKETQEMIEMIAPEWVSASNVDCHFFD